jgi:hypothetical protein
MVTTTLVPRWRIVKRTSIGSIATPRENVGCIQPVPFLLDIELFMFEQEQAYEAAAPRAERGKSLSPSDGNQFPKS